jgi:hypothetical protein
VKFHFSSQLKHRSLPGVTAVPGHVHRLDKKHFHFHFSDFPCQKPLYHKLSPHTKTTYIGYFEEDKHVPVREPDVGPLQQQHRDNQLQHQPQLRPVTQSTDCFVPAAAFLPNYSGRVAPAESNTTLSLELEQHLATSTHLALHMQPRGTQTGFDHQAGLLTNFV